MSKQIFFHQDLSNYRQLKSLGVSFLITTTNDPFKLRVTHVYCGRKEPSFSKKKARELLRSYTEQNKNTVECYVSDLPRYLKDMTERCFKPSSLITGSYFDFREYAWRFVPKAEQ